MPKKCSKKAKNKEESIDHSLVVIGKTGIGKSTWLNFIANGQLFDASGRSKACTKTVTGKQINFDGYKMTLIDAPGQCDGDGDDQKNINMLTNFLKNLKQGLSSIAIVISNSDHRLDSNIQETIKLLYNFFGNGYFWFHVCVVVTHCPHDKDDIKDLKKEMTIGEDSLRSQFIEMIKDVCYLEEYPNIPFYFFDSKKPDKSPSKEDLPKLKEWLKKCTPFTTQDLQITDVEWQYKEKRHQTKNQSGPIKPVFKTVKGNPIMNTVVEKEPYTVKEKREVDVKREIVE